MISKIKFGKLEKSYCKKSAKVLFYEKLRKPNVGGEVKLVSFSYDKLRGKIREVFGTQDRFAEALGISKSTLSQKLNNCSEFTQQEMMDSMKLLDQNLSQLDEYFFTLKFGNPNNRAERR